MNQSVSGIVSNGTGNSFTVSLQLHAHQQQQAPHPQVAQVPRGGLVMDVQEGRRFLQENASRPGAPVLLDVAWLKQMTDVCAAVCAIRKDEHVIGTGVLLEGGWIVTCAHVMLGDYRGDGQQWKQGHFRDYDDPAEAKRTFAGTTQIMDTAAAPRCAALACRTGRARKKSCCCDYFAFWKTDALVRSGARCFVVGHPVKWEGHVARESHKKLSIQRDNVIHEVDRTGFLRYFTDTSEGNSGSPALVWDATSKKIFVAAIHHTGVEFDKRDADGRVGFNEGTLLLKVLDELHENGGTSIVDELTARR